MSKKPRKKKPRRPPQGRGGGGMGGENMNHMLRQVQKMQEEMAAAQASLAERKVEATSGGGMVRVTIDGALRLTSVKIDPACVDPDDVEMLEDLITAAVSDAIGQAQALQGAALAAPVEGLDIGGIDLDALGLGGLPTDLPGLDTDPPRGVDRSDDSG